MQVEMPKMEKHKKQSCLPAASKLKDCQEEEEGKKKKKETQTAKTHAVLEIVPEGG